MRKLSLAAALAACVLAAGGCGDDDSDEGGGAPDFRMPFGHRHGEQEEVYLVLSGSARFKLEDDVIELKALDALRVPGSTTRGFEAGPEGAEIVAFGAPETDGKDVEMVQDFWTG